MEPITNPHDKFFKEVFSRRSDAVEFLQNYLPSEILKVIDVQSLEYTKETFVDRHLKDYFSWVTP
jgi:predicted transposase YdaD